MGCYLLKYNSCMGTDGHREGEALKRGGHKVQRKNKLLNNPKH